MPNNFPSWVNGSDQSQLAITDRAIAYGDGLFETIRVLPKPVLVDLHFERMADGLKRLKIAADLSAIQSQFKQYIAAYQPGLVKIIVSRGSGGRGYAAPDIQNAEIIIQGFDLPTYRSAFYDVGIDLFQCATPLTINPVLQGIKHLNRLEQVVARNEFDGAQYQEGLMAFNGSLVEGTMSNLCIVQNNELVIPCLDQCAVSGTMQRHIINTCVDAVKAVRESPKITPEMLTAADEVFVCNSVFGIWPVKSFMGKPVNVNDAGVVKLLQKRIQPLFS